MLEQLREELPIMLTTAHGEILHAARDRTKLSAVGGGQALAVGGGQALAQSQALAAV